MADILNRLNTLEGNTLGEIFHSLNVLLRNHNSDVHSNLDYILTNLTDDVHLQQLVKIRLIDEYKCHDKVLSVLKTDDSFYISHVLRCNWFFQNSDFDPKFLVDSVFPCLSYATRSKILKKYSKLLKKTEVADALFDLVKHKYGLRATLILLPACSQQFIEKLLKSLYFQIPVYIIIPIFKLYPLTVIEFILHLLEAHAKKKRVLRSFQLSHYEKLFSLIASRHPVEFTSIVEKYSSSIPYLRLGKRSTRRILNSSFDSFLNNILVFKRLVNWKYVSSGLSLDNLSILQLSFFPKTPSDFFKTFSDYSDMIQIISKIHNKNVKKDLIMKNFKKAYGRPITDFSNSFSLDLVKRLPLDVAEKYVEIKLPGIEDPYQRGDHAAYLSKDKAIRELKKMIERQSDFHVRSHLVGLLLELISINDDPSLVGPLCDYFVKRLRNERSSVKEKVIEFFARYDKLLQIPTEGWAPIEELINIILVSGEASNFSYSLTKIFVKQIQYRLERNLPVNELVERLIKFTKNRFDSVSFYKGNPFEKQFILWFLEKVSDNKTDLETNVEFIFNSICDWNKRHPKEKITIPEWILNKLEIIFQEEDTFNYRKETILKSLRKDEELLKKFYPKIFPKYIDQNILYFELKYEPRTLKENISVFLPKILDDRMDKYKLFLLKARLYTPFGIPEALCSFCLELLNERKGVNVGEEMDIEDEDYDEDKRNRMRISAITILAIMLHSGKYKEFIKDYYPSQASLEEYSSESRHLFEIQTEIARSFKLVNKCSDLTEALSKFAVGDYLKITVGPLNSVILRMSEQQVLPMLNAGLDCPVSLKKHYVRLYFTIAPLKSTLEMLLDLYNKEKNTSIRLLLLNNSMKFFTKEPSQETYYVFKTVAEKLLSSDEEAINKLFDIEDIPDEFVQDYLRLLWEDISNKNPALISQKRNKIINMIQPDIFRLITEDFASKLISYVLSQEVTFPTDMVVFLVQSLLHCTTHELQEKRFLMIKDKLSTLFNQWNSYDFYTHNVFSSRQALPIFIETLVRESFSSNSFLLSPQNLFTNVKSTLLNLNKEEDVLENVLLIEIASFFLNLKDITGSNMVPFVLHLENILEERVLVYGFEILNSVSSLVSDVFGWLRTDDVEGHMLNLSEILLKNNKLYCQILGLKFLPKTVRKDPQRYEELMKIILQISDLSAKIFVNKLLKQVQSNVTN